MTTEENIQSESQNQLVAPEPAEPITPPVEVAPTPGLAAPVEKKQDGKLKGWMKKSLVTLIIWAFVFAAGFFDSLFCALPPQGG